MSFAVVGGGRLDGDVVHRFQHRRDENICRCSLGPHATLVQQYEAVAVARREIQIVQHDDRGDTQFFHQV